MKSKARTIPALIFIVVLSAGLFFLLNKIGNIKDVKRTMAASDVVKWIQENM